MFDTSSFAELDRATAQAAAACDDAGLATGTQACDALRTVQRVQDVLDGVHAALLVQVEESEGYADQGASSTTSWARQVLRLPAGEAKKRQRAGQTLAVLPDVSAALAAGRVRLAHVYEFTSGITKLGVDVMVDAQEILLPVAESCDPMVLREVISQLHEVLHPDDLDDKYAKGMNRRDITAAKCGDGWHLSGFLDAVVGAKLQEFLKSVSAPEGEGDDRAPSDRRVDGLENLLDHADDAFGDTDEHDYTGAAADDRDDRAEPAGDTEPADDTETVDAEAGGDDAGQAGGAAGAAGQPAPARRRRPSAQLLVLADLETLLRRPGAEPATLAGFGHIGNQLLGYLTCGSDTSGILTDGVTTGPVPQAKILNVGRASRLATTAQRRAVTARQDGTCAAPGCGLTRLDVHHAEWWHRDGGRTDLDNLIGLCSRCHHLVHQNKLVIRHDGAGGFTFRRQTGRIIDDHTRVTKRRVRDALAKLRHILTDDEDATATSERAHNGTNDQADRLAAHGITVHRISYHQLTTTDPPTLE